MSFGEKEVVDSVCKDVYGNEYKVEFLCDSVEGEWCGVRELDGGDSLGENCEVDIYIMEVKREDFSDKYLIDWVEVEWIGEGEEEDECNICLLDVDVFEIIFWVFWKFS